MFLHCACETRPIRVESTARICIEADRIHSTQRLGIWMHFVYDTIYQPPVTPLLAVANGVGCRTANGLSMLIEQGALAFQHWFPGAEALAVMRAALTRE